MTALASLRSALRRGEDPATAAAGYLDARAAAGAFWHGDGQLGTCDFSAFAVDAAALILTGRGRMTSHSLARRVVYVDLDPSGNERVRPLGRVPSGELNVYGLLDLAWIRLLASDGEPLPELPAGRGVLGRRGSRVYAAIRAHLAGNRAGTAALVRLEGGKAPLMAVALGAR